MVIIPSRAPSRPRPRALSTPLVDVIHPAAALSTDALDAMARAPRRTYARATPSRRHARAHVNDKNITIHIRASTITRARHARVIIIVIIIIANRDR